MQQSIFSAVRSLVIVALLAGVGVGNVSLSLAVQVLNRIHLYIILLSINYTFQGKNKFRGQLGASLKDRLGGIPTDHVTDSSH